MKQWIVVCLVLFSGSLATAQSGLKTFYLDSKHKEVSAIDSASYIRKIGQIDSLTNLYPVIEYYRDSSIKCIGQSLSSKTFYRTGLCTDYYPGNTVKRSGSYSKGRAVGEHIFYYPNGNLQLTLVYAEPEKDIPNIGRNFLIQASYDTLGNQTVKNGFGYCKMINEAIGNLYEEGRVVNGMRDSLWRCHTDSNKVVLTEMYKDGVLLSGTSVFRNGESYRYQKREVDPQFKQGLFGGFDWFMRSNIRYPKQAYRNKIHGRVTITFVITKDGAVSNAYAAASPGKELSDEGIRLINKTSGHWIPGVQYGKKVNVQYTIPLSFSINEGK
ncbi:energy transducer TonB [Mucilaginibacter aquatilis]|uniref:TonB family protein n=1 Tax=Mucilaginibacter aquatilis TaxID=1517760 RepID=A0A6I4IEF7_9SPHI|nr:energy transducer TonB [Mucilaginibacter aquatilis]MVN92178.1 TonB family protein [Mucilaginibacter aquatilis]